MGNTNRKTNNEFRMKMERQIKVGVHRFRVRKFRVAFLLLTFTNPQPLNPEPVNGYK